MAAGIGETNRKIHLDFHTPHWVKQVGADYDPELLVATWKRANVNAVTVVFGLCACGNAYYESDVAPVHPALQRDLLTPLLPAAEREGIKVYVHFAPGINDRAVIEHPEWAMVRRDGTRLDTNGGKEWGWPCYNSPFVADWLWPQLAEFVPRFPNIEGVFVDMVMYADETCFCEFCRRRAGALGLDLDRLTDRDRLQELTLNEFIERTRAIVKNANPDLSFTCNCRNFVGGVRNGNLDYLELEAPITWNSYYYPVLSRHIRTLGKRAGGMTTRFPKNWGYFGSLINEAQLKFECASILATLGSCCIGDQLHPSGKPDAGVYELIGTVYGFVKEREAWALDAATVPYIGVVADRQRNLGAQEVRDGYEAAHQAPASLYGAGLALLEGSRHFDVLDEENGLSGYRLLWLPENITLDPALAPKVERYVAEGGRLLVTGGTLWEQPVWRDTLERLAGVRLAGIEAADGGYVQPVPPYADRMPDAPCFVKGRFPRWTLQSADAVKAASTFRPFEDISLDRRFGHFHAPAGEEAEAPGAVVHPYGKGMAAVAAASLGADYFTIGSRHVRQMALNLIDALLEPEHRLLEVEADSPAVEVSLMSQPGRWVLHLIQYAAKRMTENTVIEEAPPRYRIPVTLRPPAKPRRVALAPSGEEPIWTWEDGAVRLVVPELRLHQMVVFEWEEETE
ncbi:alpha-amylase family protein [Cohnella zeiphila]|uniref:Beta-galactosidase trimerisation domain-containing protein n=1 Tax=Cohnella zeiphila TaxID=2761120 RepID=A0A7X0SJ93_9BACL|nr:alpha-amylase family protein [Cohnella zeiphila]MBB6730916.1 hypothetical protein [Cohnella zeiphila]